MTNSVVFTERKFTEMVRDYTDKFFEEYDLYEVDRIEVNYSGRMTSGLGYFKYKRSHGEYVPMNLTFSKQLLDGRFHIDDVMEVVKHEIIHYLAFELGYIGEGHGSNFKHLCDSLGCSFDGTKLDMRRTAKFEVTSKYILECVGCGKKTYLNRMQTAVKHPEWCSCAKCGGKIKRTK